MAALMLLMLLPSVVAFSSVRWSATHRQPMTTIIAVRQRRRPSSPLVSSPSLSLLSSKPHQDVIIIRLSSSWNDFAYDDADDEILFTDSPIVIDKDFVAADENDDPSIKAAAGMALAAPNVDYFGPVMEVPQGEKKDIINLTSREGFSHRLHWRHRFHFLSHTNPLFL